MKRDMDLVRAILIVIENNEKEYLEQGEVSLALSEQFPELQWSGEQLIPHVKMMEEAGLVGANIISAMRGGAFTHLRMTWDGQDFLANARDPSIWEKARPKVGRLSFDLIKQLLMTLTKDAMLP